MPRPTARSLISPAPPSSRSRQHRTCNTGNTSASTPIEEPRFSCFPTLPPSILEQTERLEQLRFLENGIDIHVEPTDFDTIGVDTRRRPPPRRSPPFAIDNF